LRLATGAGALDLDDFDFDEPDFDEPDLDGLGLNALEDALDLDELDLDELGWEANVDEPDDSAPDLNELISSVSESAKLASATTSFKSGLRVSSSCQSLKGLAPGEGLLLLLSPAVIFPRPFFEQLGKVLEAKSVVCTMRQPQ
jgi:hypothetical protein